MSITASYRRLSPDEFKRLLSDPKAANDFGLVSLKDLDDLDDLDSFDAEANLEESDRYLDIGRFWHSLHFLLTGKTEMDKTEVPPPLGSVVLGGTETKWEATYGMVRYLNPEEVKGVASALKEINEEGLRRRDLTSFPVDLYSHPGSWEADDLEILIDVFIQIRDFFSQAARDGDVVLLSSD